MTDMAQSGNRVDAKEMELRYQRAEYLEQGIWTKKNRLQYYLVSRLDRR